MATATNYKWVIDRIRDGGFKCYRILNGASEKEIIAENLSGELNPESAASEVEVILQNLTGSVMIELSKLSNIEKKDNGGRVPTNQRIRVNLGAEPNSAIGNTNQNNQMSIGAIMQAQEDKFNARLEYLQKENELKNEISELKRKLDEDNKPNKYEQYIPVILQAITGGSPAPITGVPENSDTKTIIINAVNRLCKVDPEFPQVLEKLADMAETNPSKYQMAKKFL